MIPTERKKRMKKSQLTREPIIDKCVGCDKVRVGPERGVGTCVAFLYPSVKWRIGNCPLASHLKREVGKEKFVDPIKKSKRMVGK